MNAKEVKINISDGVIDMSKSSKSQTSNDETLTSDQVRQSILQIAKDSNLRKVDPLSKDIKLRDLAKRSKISKKVLELQLESEILNIQSTSKANADEKKRDPQVRKVLINSALERDKFWRSPDGKSHVTVRFDHHVANYPVVSKAYKDFLWLRYSQEHNDVPMKQVVSETIDYLDAVCSQSGAKIFEPRQRVGYAEGAIYLDLINDTWDVVKITSDGWRVISNIDCPVKFVRRTGMLPLPLPVETSADAKFQAKASIENLLNLRDEKTAVLFWGCLSMAFCPWGPFPVIVCVGAKGSGKSTLCRAFSLFIDPNAAGIRSMPAKEADVHLAAFNSWLPVFDNLSGISKELSDLLCKCATGTTHSKRQLYSDDSESLMSYRRMVLINGIDDLASRGDLVDRAVLIYLSSISENERLDERTVVEEIEKIRPVILALMLDSAAAALENSDKLEFEKLPRMADFSRWVTAAEPALGYEMGTFLSCYSEAKNEAIGIELESDAVATLLLNYSRLSGNVIFEGTAAELRENLNRWAGDDHDLRKAIPKNPRTISDKLRRLEPSLESCGIIVIRPPRKAEGRFIKIVKKAVP